MSVKKRGKGWLISIYLGRDATTGKKNYYYETFHAPTKSLAQDRERELKNQLKPRKAGPNVVYTNLGEYMDYFYSKKARSLRKGSLQTYASYIRKLKPLIGHLQLWTITFEEIDRIFRVEFFGLSMRYQKNLYDFTKEVIQDAIDSRRVPMDALVGWETPAQEKKIRDVLSEDQIRGLLDFLASGTYRYGFVFYLLLITGARAGEILGLCEDVVDFQKNQITIRRTIDLHSTRLQDEPKTSNSYRTIQFGDEEMALFKRYIQDIQNRKVVSIKKDSLIFQTKNGKPVRYSTIQKTWKSILKQLDIEHVRIHDIRHSVITYLLNQNVSIIQVASLAGQDVNTTTRTYAHKMRKGNAVEF